MNDAACLDQPSNIVNLSAGTVILKRQRSHKRQSINCNAHGSPASKDFPNYNRLPRARQGYTTPPSHSTGPRRLHGSASGDLVLITRRDGSKRIGRATVDLKTDGCESRGNQRPAPERIETA